MHESIRIAVASALTFVTDIDAAPTAPLPATRPTRRIGHVLGAGLAGLLAAGVAVGVGHLVASVVKPAASPLIAVGGAFIDLTPEWLKTFAIATFGQNDKTALLVGITLTLAAIAIAIGLVALRSRPLAGLGIAAFGLVGALAALTRPGADVLSPVPSIVGALAGIAALIVLVRALDPSASNHSAVSTPSRRRFLTGLVGVGVLASGAGGLGILLNARRAAAGTAVVIPVPMEPAPAVPAAVSLGVDGISPFMTPNDAFYRVDTALEIPAVSAADWRLRVHGMVDREITLTLDELLQLPLIERDITLTCVSNVVGGQYAGNARWIGVPLKTVLDMAGVQAGADQIVSTSVDGFTVGTPTAVALDGRDAILAVSMNGEPLPAVHGFPVRMVVPGLYGYVSATKWLVDLELTTFAAFDPYWVQRGWDQQAPIKTMARIDTPRAFAALPAGTVAVGGVAWAQHRGIAKVEVRADGGDWHAATLGAADTLDTWRQWTYAWDASTAGHHTLEVRATDATGATQTDQRAEPFPNGATGWHSVVVTVS